MFKYGDQVEVHSTDSWLDGQNATVVGIASKQIEFTTYIIEFPEDVRRIMPDKMACIALTESCLVKCEEA